MATEETRVNETPVEDLNEILRVRREKFANLVEAGDNPFEI